MNHSLSSFTARVKPSNYDSLQIDIGVKDVVTGTLEGDRLRNLFAFLSYRVEANSSDRAFSQPATVAYLKGPASTGDAPPFFVDWAVWRSTTGLRAGRFNVIVPPASGSGTLSGLFPTQQPDHLSAAFSIEGLLAIAVQEGDNTIRIRRYVNEDDAAVIHENSFTGYSPAMVFTGVGHFGGDQPYPEEIACFFLRRSQQRSIFARFEGEDFATEREVISNLPSDVARLISARFEDGILSIFLLDEEDREITISTGTYHGNTGPDDASHATEFVSGTLFDSVAREDLAADAGTLAAAFVSGKYGLSVVETDVLSDDSGSVSVAFLSGLYY